MAASAAQQPMSWPAMTRSQVMSYREAIKAHQRQRLEYVRDESEKLRQFLTNLRNEVTRLEESSQHSASEDWKEKIARLREENRKLRIECHCLAMEVDLHASGQIPLGVTDENFYNRNLPAGPQLQTQRSCPPPTMNRSLQPPSYEESIAPPPRMFTPGDILDRVPPAPRPVWLSPTIQQQMQHSGSSPPLPPRPSSASPRTPPPPVVPISSGEEGQKWSCEKCTVENHPALIYCEVCEMPRNGYLGANRA